MSNYVIKFYKEGYIKYISHLDLLRLFRRLFKREEIKLQHSQGFNPHPKMSFAQPLSLGYESSCEYLEFETENSYKAEEIKEKLNRSLPNGMGILNCDELEPSKKTLAALTEAADYEITIPCDEKIELKETIENYLSQKLIIIKKVVKKSGKEIEVDIKPMIKTISGIIDDNKIMLTAKVDAGSISNLSPEIVLSTFCDYANIKYDRPCVGIKRTAIYFFS